MSTLTKASVMSQALFRTNVRTAPNTLTNRNARDKITRAFFVVVRELCRFPPRA